MHCLRAYYCTTTVRKRVMMATMVRRQLLFYYATHSPCVQEFYFICFHGIFLASLDTVFWGPHSQGGGRQVPKYYLVCLTFKPHTGHDKLWLGWRKFGGCQLPGKRATHWTPLLLLEEHTSPSSINIIWRICFSCMAWTIDKTVPDLKGATQSNRATGMFSVVVIVSLCLFFYYRCPPGHCYC